MNDAEAYEYYADPANLVLAGPPVRRRKPRKTAILSVRFEPDVIERVRRLADAWGIDFSDWIRAAVRREEYRQRVKWLDAHRDGLEVVPGSGRPCEPRAVPSSLSLLPPRSFACRHMSVSGVVSASCGECGPLPAAA